MGRTAKIKKVKRMMHKKKQKEMALEQESEPSISSTEEQRMIINSAIRPPYQVILDTNFINDCIRKKIDMRAVLSECLDGEVKLLIPECVYGELEKLGRVHRLALNMIKNEETTTLKCQHKGTYADDCIISRVKEFKCYVVATSDTCLRQRIKKQPCVPVVYFRGHRVATDRFVGGL